MPQRPSVAYNVYFDGQLSNDILQPLSITDTADGARLATATLEYKGFAFEDLDVSLLLNKPVEITRAQTGAVVHWGKVTQLPTLISSAAGEVMTIVSRCEPYHLGRQVDGYWVWDPVVGAPVLVDGDLVFNPLIDGVVYGNLNDTKVTIPAGDPLFLDPESVRTAAAQALQGANVDFWSLAKAVYYLIWSLNTAQTYIFNPPFAAIAAVFNDPAALVQDVRIPRGTYLGEALDLLIVPLGYHWRIERTDLGARRFAFWKRGTGGDLVAVAHQRAGASLSNPRNLGETNVDTAGITFDVSRLANEIVVRGGFAEYEVTVELARGWPEEDDPTAGVHDELAKDHKDFAEVRDVLRKWVLNEAGDYIGLRPEIDGLWTAAFRDALSEAGLSNQFVPRRRRLLPTLTLAADGAPIGLVQGVEVEYSTVSDEPDWKPIGNWGCHLLDRECGVYFDGDRLPEEFLLDPTNLRIRVTATIQADFRLSGIAVKLGASPNHDVVPLTLDLPDRFRFRVRDHALSKYNGSGLPSLAVNDSTAVVEFAQFCRTAWDLMDVGGTIQIEGLDNSYKISDRVQRIEHKNVSFEAQAGSAAYPQIVAVERNIEQQTTTLHLQRYSDPIPLPHRPRGTSSRFSPRSSSRRAV